MAHHKPPPPPPKKHVSLNDLDRMNDLMDKFQRGYVFGEKYILQPGSVAGRPHIRYAKIKGTREPIVLKFFASREKFNHSRAMHERLSEAEHVCRVLDIIEEYPPCLVFEKGADDVNGWMKKARPHRFDKRANLYHMLTALDELHTAGIVHCDLNPSKLMYFMSEYSWKFVGLDRASFIGTPTTLSLPAAYAPPEVFKAEQEGKTEITLESSTDMWAFGILAFEILMDGERFYGHGATAKTVRNAMKPSEIKKRIAVVDEWQCRRLLTKNLKMDPAERWTARRSTQTAAFRPADDSD